jgi:enoyl-CoA hydratase/carnithine racemase
VSDLLVEKHGHTTVLTLNRPHRMNALGGTLRTDIPEALQEFVEDPKQLVLIVTGAGDSAFCAGADLKEMADVVGSGTRMPVAASHDLFGFGGCEKVTIAAINGLAAGGGLEIAINCDIRIASPNAWFAMPEVKRGFLGGPGVSVLPRLLPIGAVMDLMLTGDRMSAEDAYRLGLVQRLVPQEELLATALAKADSIARNSQAAVWGTKQVVRFWRNALIEEQHRYYETVIQRVLLSRDFLEGPVAFAEKREPVFHQAWPSPFDSAPD